MTCKNKSDALFSAFLFVLMASFSVSSAYAHSDTNAPPAAAAQKHTSVVYKTTLFQIDTENHISSENHTATNDGCYKHCCEIFAGTKFCSNEKPSNKIIFYENHIIHDLQNFIVVASSHGFIYSSLQNELQYRVLLI